MKAVTEKRTTGHMVDKISSKGQENAEKRSGFKEKDSGKLVFWLFFFPLLCIAFLCLHASHRNLGKIQTPRLTVDLLDDGEDIDPDASEETKLLLERFVRGKEKEREKLRSNKVACVADTSSTFCVTSAAVRITAVPARSSTVYLSAGQRLSSKSDIFAVRPYPRTGDPEAMKWTEPINLVAGEPSPPLCDVTHNATAVLFSTGGLAGNLYSDVSELLIPLYLTAGTFGRSNVELVVTDYHRYWVERYGRFLRHLSSHEPVFGSSPHGDVYAGVHCFPAAVVGLKFHGDLTCNSSKAPGGADALGFKRFLREAYLLRNERVRSSAPHRPMLVFLWRWKSRAILNEEEVIKLAEKIGFRVEISWPTKMGNMEELSELVNSCSVLMGVYGSGLASMVFLPSDAVVLQIIPLGLESEAETRFGRRTAESFGLKYVGYDIDVKESSLFDLYSMDHPILANPNEINPRWENMTKPIYADEQNVTVNISRFRGALVRAITLLPTPNHA